MGKSEKYQQFVEKLKTGHAYTWGGRFTADIVLATALINQVCDQEGIERPRVHRLFDTDKAAQFSENNIVYGIGFSGCEFDYRGGDEPDKILDNGVTQAAFGRIYNIVGEQLHKDYAAPFAKAFVDKMDACETDAVPPGKYQEMIKFMNPNWNDTFPVNEAFQNAVRMAEQTITQRVEDIGTGQDISPNYLSSIEYDLYEEGFERKEASMIAANELVALAINNHVFSIQGTDERNYDVICFENKPLPPHKDIQNIAQSYGNFVGYTVPIANDRVAFKLMEGVDNQKLPYPQLWQEGERPEGISIHPATGVMTCDSMSIWESAFTTMVTDSSIYQSLENTSGENQTGSEPMIEEEELSEPSGFEEFAEEEL